MAETEQGTKTKRFGRYIAEKFGIGRNLNQDKNDVVLSYFFNCYKMFWSKQNETDNPNLKSI